MSARTPNSTNVPSITATPSSFTLPAASDG